MLSKVYVVLLPLIMSQLISMHYPRTSNDPWYNSLNKSPWTPPGQIFGPVWTILYLTIGWSLFKYPHDWLTINLILNFSWIVVFQGWHDLQLSSLILALMIISLLAYLLETKNWLLIPYLIWTIFATYLNGYLWLKN